MGEELADETGCAGDEDVHLEGGGWMRSLVSGWKGS